MQTNKNGNEGINSGISFGNNTTLHNTGENTFSFSWRFKIPITWFVLAYLYFIFFCNLIEQVAFVELWHSFFWMQ